MKSAALLVGAVLISIIAIAQAQQPDKKTEAQRVEQLEHKVQELELKVNDLQERMRMKLRPAVK